MSAILVTGATGVQGSSTVKYLLSRGATVHALTRSPSSPAAQSLASLGAKIFEGSFSSASSLQAALVNVSAVFLNVIPWSETGEVADAQSVITACHAPGSTVKHFVFTSVTMADWADNLHGAERQKILLPGGFQDGYWKDKSDIEKMVQKAGFKTWAIIRPAMFMSNLLNVPGGYFYPKLVEGGDYATIKLAADPWGPKTSYVHPDDIGKAAADVLLRPEHWNGRIVDVAAETEPLGWAYKKMEEKGGKRIEVERYSEEEVEKIGVSDPLVEVLRVWASVEIVADLSTMKEEGIEMRSFDQFLDEKREDLLKTLGVSA